MQMNADLASTASSTKTASLLISNMSGFFYTQLELGLPKEGEMRAKEGAIKSKRSKTCVVMEESFNMSLDFVSCKKIIIKSW